MRKTAREEIEQMEVEVDRVLDEIRPYIHSAYVPKTDDLCGVNSIYVSDTYPMPDDCPAH